MSFTKLGLGQQAFQQAQQSSSTTSHPLLPASSATHWMPRPYPIPGCPPGLEYLMNIDRILVHQKVDYIEAFTGWEEENRYAVRNGAGEKIYYAFEKSGCCGRICCKSNRGFEIHIVDNFNQECLRISRNFKCCVSSLSCIFAGCCNCCANEIKIETPSRQVLGYVKQRSGCCNSNFYVLNEEKEAVMKIHGPCCIADGACMPCDSDFKILSLDESITYGRITKKYSGFVKELFTKADLFTVEFQFNMPINLKATLFGALFLIDFMYFEKDPKKNHVQSQISLS